ncbi:procathepsin L-like [Tribolium madens]|uniref:procathepsin L-like n=1 Tax=Tribolium madens TaxID=41895 RepID=UPI001CF72D61|nr:procathepsin L-like [Tribolium madens]
MKLFIILILASYAISATISDYQLESQWENFKKKYDRKYLDAKEEAFRKGLFANTLKFVQKQNVRYDEGLEQFRLGITSLADFTEEEKEKGSRSGRRIRSRLGQDFRDFSDIKVTDIKNAIDWRARGFMSKVKNQSTCGSCWAFSAIGAIEARLNIKSKTSELPTLSEQQILDCSPIAAGDCKYGWIKKALNYLYLNKGINSDFDYKYEAKANKSNCRYDKTKSVAKLIGYSSIPYYVKNKEHFLAKLVATEGPVSAAIHISKNDKKNFDKWKKTDIYETKECAQTITKKKLNHAIVVAGYGSLNGKDYWLIKNSYGENWGDKGYMKLLRNGPMHCGIGLNVYYPIV